MIELVGIKKSYAGRCVLDAPAFTVEAGGRYALLGPNGSGKTTLLRILAGTLRPDAGTVHTSLPPGSVGYLPQSPYAFDLTVLQNVLLGADGKSRAERNARAMAALERVGLASLCNARGSRLSGGERQRMALARLLSGSHRLLLLDEPTASVDIEAGSRIERGVADYCAEERCTLVFSSHAPSLALRLASSVLMLENGRVAESGPAETVLQNPAAESTRRFLLYWKL